MNTLIINTARIHSVETIAADRPQNILLTQTERVVVPVKGTEPLSVAVIRRAYVSRSNACPVVVTFPVSPSMLKRLCDVVLLISPAV